MEREVCIRCGGEMVHVGQEHLQMGKFQFLTGALAVDIYCCRDCKKLEFYAVEEPEEEEDSMAQVPCPFCGELHELDDPKCPHCGKRLME